MHTLIPGLKSLGSVVLLLIIGGPILTDVFSFDLSTTLTKTFLEDFGLAYKFVFIAGVMLVEHATIMIGFYLIDSGPIISGLAYNGRDERGN